MLLRDKGSILGSGLRNDRLIQRTQARTPSQVVKVCLLWQMCVERKGREEKLELDWEEA